VTVQRTTIGNTSGTINIPFVTLTICQPNTSTCATINNVLVDTGSVGLRIFASILTGAGISLAPMTDPSTPANSIAECLPFADGYTWGSVSLATLKIGGETASNFSVQVVNDNASYIAAPSGCTASGGQSLNSPGQFGANAVIGIGAFPQDCSAMCAQCNLTHSGCTSTNDFYYSCNTTATSCSPTPVALTAQVDNPIIYFGTDNNGSVLVLDAISPNGQPSAKGTLIFGISTQSNNAPGNAAVLTLDDFGTFTSTLNGTTTLSSSFIDSGSNIYLFNDSLTKCGTSAPENEFYCQATTLSLVNQGHDVNGAAVGSTSSISLPIADFNTLNPGSNAALDDVAGPLPSGSSSSGGSSSITDAFDFGLPFFYGRHVYTGIATAASAGVAATPPYVAYQ
jgi:hypothetical protein